CREFRRVAPSFRFTQRRIFFKQSDDKIEFTRWRNFERQPEPDEVPFVWTKRETVAGGGQLSKIKSPTSIPYGDITAAAGNINTFAPCAGCSSSSSPEPPGNSWIRKTRPQLPGAGFSPRPKYERRTISFGKIVVISCATGFVVGRSACRKASAHSR